MGGFCLVVELHQEGSATNGATSSICLLSIQKACPGYTQTIKTDYDMFHFQFMDPLSSFSVGYKGESNDANDSKKEDLSQLFGI